MFLYGNRFKNTNLKEYHTDEEKYQFIIDETQIKVGNDYFWLWVAIELNNKLILDIYLSVERNMIVAESFIQNR